MTIRLGNKIISGGGSSGVPGWTGTLAEYNNLTEIDDNMLYYITDDCLDETNSSYSASLELGDVGFTALGVNEELNLRRYLNGQVIAMDEFPEFTAKLKHAVSLNSEISVTEAMWQSEVVLSPNGICYKFVIDDDNMTIRLPKYPEYFIAGLSDKTGVAGNGMTLGLFDDGRGYGLVGRTYQAAMLSSNTAAYGEEMGVRYTPDASGFSPDGYTMGITTDPSKSGIEALVDSASEKIRGYYFIQVATGLEQNADITREITLNNPFFLGMYQYFEVEPNNISWLKSEGQWNSAEVYPGMWEWLLEERNKGLKQLYIWTQTNTSTGTTNITRLEKDSNLEVGDLTFGWTPLRVTGEVVADNGDGTYNILINGTTYKIQRDANTDTSYDGIRYIPEFSDVNVFTVQEIETYTDYDSTYDFIIDTVTNTFRLPIKVKGAAGKAVAGNGMTLGLTDGVSNAGLFNGNISGTYRLSATQNDYGNSVGANHLSGDFIGEDKLIGVTLDPSKSGLETSTEGLHLYFYVGETVQDPTLINVGRITHALSLKTDMGQAAHAAMPSNKYIDLTLGSTDTSYIAPADGYFCLQKVASTSGQYIQMNNTTSHFVVFSNSSGAYGQAIIMPCKRNDNIITSYTTAGNTLAFRFIYAEGAQ